MSLRRRQLVNGASAASFDPTTVLTAWLENSTSAGAISSVTDRMNANPATQGTAGRQPVGNASGVITFDGNDCLSWPLVANQNKPADAQATDALAFALWFKPASIAANQQLVCIHTGTAGASVSTYLLYTAGDSLRLDIRNNGLVGRRANVPTVLVVGTPVFITGEFNGAMGSETARHVITVNGVVQVASFSALSAGVSDVVLNDPTGNLLIGSAANADVGNEPILVGGQIGRDVYARASSGMSGATEGSWTAATRTSLKNHRPLV